MDRASEHAVKQGVWVPFPPRSKAGEQHHGGLAESRGAGEKQTPELLTPPTLGPQGSGQIWSRKSQEALHHPLACRAPRTGAQGCVHLRPGDSSVSV